MASGATVARCEREEYEESRAASEDCAGSRSRVCCCSRLHGIICPLSRTAMQATGTAAAVLLLSGPAVAWRHELLKRRKLTCLQVAASDIQAAAQC